MKYLKNLVIIMFLVLLTGCSILKKEENKETKNEEIKQKTKKETSLSMVMAGDVLIHSGVYYDAKTGTNSYDFKPMLSSVKSLVQNHDLAFVNQETIIGGKSMGLSTYPRFNSPEEVGDAIVDLGFNIINLTNNHTLDRGEEAVINSLNYWKNKPVKTVGSYNSLEERNTPLISEKNGIKYAIFGYTTVTNGLTPALGKEYLTNIYSEEKAKSDIESVKGKVDVIIVSMHWGTEYTNTPTSEQTTIANYLSNLGVNLIIGHHPHVIEPITYVNNTLVIYSLGNFISGQEGLNKQIGMLATLNIKKTVEDGNTSISFENVSSELLYTHYDNGYKNYHVYPFYMLNDSLLNNYQSVKEQYSSIVRMYDQNIIVK